MRYWRLLTRTFASLLLFIAGAVTIDVVCAKPASDNTAALAPTSAPASAPATAPDAKTMQAKIKNAREDIWKCEDAIDAYKVHVGRFPTEQEGFDALINKPKGAKGWLGPYLKKLPIDPWGNPYVYHFPGKHNKGSYNYDLTSNGPDGKESTEDDVVNWEKK